MIFQGIVFWFAAILALGGALGVVLLRNPFYSVLALVGHLVALAVLFLLLSAQFLAVAQLLVYAGAVMVLYVFVVSYIGGSDEPLAPESGAVARLGPLFAVALLTEVTIAVTGSGLRALDSGGPKVGASFGTPAQIGTLLLQRFLIPFEAASFLLLVAAVGAVVLARRRRGLEETGAERTTQLGQRAVGGEHAGDPSPAGARGGETGPLPRQPTSVGGEVR